MPALPPPKQASQEAIAMPLTCAVILPSNQLQPGENHDAHGSTQQAHAPNRHACSPSTPNAASSPGPSRAQHARPDIHITMPSSPFATISCPTSPHRTPSMEQGPPGPMHAYSPVPGSPMTARRSDGSGPSSPSKSPLRRQFSPAPSTSPPPSPDVFTDFRTASQHLVGTVATPGRRQTLYAACTFILNTLSVVCIVSFAVSWYRTYSFDAARTDLITTLRCILLLLAPLSLWLLPTLSVISALMAWPHMASPPAVSADTNPDDSPISFRIPAKPRSFDSASSETYAIAAASEELLHDSATPRFGFTVCTDPQHGVTDGAIRPLTPQDIAAACREGANRVADSLSVRALADHRRPLLPATAKPRLYSHVRGGGGCCARMCAIVSVWLRHEALLGVLCALAGYGTLALALFDRDVLAQVAGVEIVTQSTPQLHHLARVWSTFIFCLYSILVTSECICAVLSVWCHVVLRRRGRWAA